MAQFRSGLSENERIVVKMISVSDLRYSKYDRVFGTGAIILINE